MELLLMPTIGSSLVLRLLSTLAVASIVVFAGCGVSSTPNEKAKPVSSLSPEDVEKAKALLESPEAKELQKKLEDAKKANPKLKTKGVLKQ
jgi:uncharacterized membrane protein